MKKYFLLLGCLLSFSFLLQAQTDTAKLNQYFDLLEKNNKAMVSVFLTKNDSIIYQRAIGYSVAENKKPSNVYTAYRIGSISKMFTAVMVLQLVDEKKLKLDTKLSEFFPTMKNSQQITIEHLLKHRSGIENFTNAADYTTYMQKPQSKESMLSLCEKMNSEFAPGTKFSYSNTNYVLLTFIIERVTKSTFAAELLKRICAKAGLSDTRVGGPINPAANEAYSYDFENDQWKKSSETDMSVPGGAGNIVSTAKDLCTFIKVLFEGKLIPTHLLEKMKTLQDGYGLGMVKFPFGARIFYGHTGGIDGFQSMLGYNEADHTAMCILGNGFNYANNHIAIALLSGYYNEAFQLPDFSKKAKNPVLSKSLEGEYNNEKINMRIKVFQENAEWKAQAQGQSAFPLTKVSALEYHFVAGGIQMIFIEDQNKNISGFKLLQGGMELLFERD